MSFTDRLGGLGFGGDYNPEQWPDELRAEDVRLMAEAGVNLVTVGVFGWARVEPAPGAYDFSYFDTVLDALAAAGVTVDLATMTASPPPWLATEHPEILPVTQSGTVLAPGGRQHYCPSSPVYRERAARLVEALAAHYKDHPALGFWHVGNEYGCHVAECFCEESARDFRRWLRGRYGDVEGLNAAWCTDFWSQRYTSFDQILPPRLAPTYANPAQQLDFKRFSNEALRACFEVEAAILRRVTPGVPVLTNFLAHHKPVDVHSWADRMDIVGLDSYPDPFWPRSHVAAGLAYDLARGAHGGDPWYLVEQAPSAVNWRRRNGIKEPGLMRLWSWQAIAHGADAVLYFQWRQSRGGAEKFHSGMVPHAGPDTRVFREVAALGAELAAVPELAGTRVVNDVAVLFDWNSWWALELDSRPSDGLKAVDRALDHYGPLFDLGVRVDVLPPGADLSGYRLVVVPNLYLLTDEHAGRLADYVSAGGHLLVSFFTSVVDGNDRVHHGGCPGPLREALGLRIEEYRPAAEGETFPLGEGTADLWREDVRIEGADVLLAFPDGTPAVTRNGFGTGTVRYVTTRPDETIMRTVLAEALAEAGAEPVLRGLPDGVQAAVRTGGGGEFLLLLNHTDEARTVDLPHPFHHLLAPGRPEVEQVTLHPRDVAVLARHSRSEVP
ncbi:beta-galactosidase [Microtetraspora fusca]|uniref:beta-galactosidase n=1 Tax=Microtetraspora fusca TaxID=1997 RepID=UPI0008353BA2|nr:beta-galactosidase [Microtetraspora fusca]